MTKAASPDPLRTTLRAVLGFRDGRDVTDAHLIAAAKAVSKRADDAEIEIAHVHALLTERRVNSPDTDGLVVRVTTALDQRDRARDDLAAYRSRGLPPKATERRDDDLDDAINDLWACFSIDIKAPPIEVVRLATETIRAYRSRGMAPKATEPATGNAAAIVALLDHMHEAAEDNDPVSPHVVAALRALLGVDRG